MNSYHIIFTLKDFVYLNERLFYEKKSDDETVDQSNAVIQINENDDIISIEKHYEMMQKSLYWCTQLMTLNIGCWHKYLEIECSCPLDILRNEFSDKVDTRCNGKCPWCDDLMQMIIQPLL